MWLLNVQTIKLEGFVNETAPPYAILSHTWGDEEVNFETLKSGNFHHLQAFAKITQSCKLARQEGYRYIWIDTCCIDKSSSAELSEAINSMFNYYQLSQVCYVYLSDVHCTESHSLDSIAPALRRSRWFTRGWTLQELLAPNTVVFLDSSWHEFGSKGTLAVAKLISKITSIDEKMFKPGPFGYGYNIVRKLRDYSVAQKMSWAARRYTTRLEDQAYCLMGLFEVNMPLLYGEGRKAFIRLQEEIMKISNDSSLFAWEANDLVLNDAGLLATSPSLFADGGDIRHLSHDSVPYPSLEAGPTPVYEKGKNTVRLLVSDLGSVWNNPALEGDGVLCLRPRGNEPRYITFSQFFRDSGWGKNQTPYHVVMLDCGSAPGRIGLLVFHYNSGIFARSPMLSRIYLRPGTPIQTASYRHFKFGTISNASIVDMEDPGPQNKNSVQVTTFTAPYGYSQTDSGGSIRRSTHSQLVQCSSSLEFSLFKNATDTASWPPFLLLYRLRDQYSDEILDARYVQFNCLRVSASCTVQDARAFAEEIELKSSEDVSYLRLRLSPSKIVSVKLRSTQTWSRELIVSIEEE